MSVYYANQAFAPTTSIEFDEAKQLYVGEVYSRGALQMVEGPDYVSVDRQVNAILAAEYEELVRAVEKDVEERGRSLSLGGGSDGRQEQSEKAPYIDLSMPYQQFGVAASMGLAAFDSVFSLWNSLGTGKKRFAASFGGALVIAGSRRDLKKKLIRERNKRIQRIMQHVRQHQRERENASTTERMTSAATSRIRAKKQNAVLKGPDAWQDRMMSKARNRDFEKKIENLRERVKEKKQEAQLNFWVKPA